MKKVGSVCIYLFAFGMILCLFAGAIALIGFIIALIMGGEIATQICVFIQKQYFPVVIQATSVVAGIGLLGMYLSRMRALSVKGSESAPK